MIITLDKFQPRHYQLPIIDAIENKGYKRVVAILPRRAGKDIMAWNICIRAALRRPMVIFYLLPTYSQARKVIWDSITITGESFLSFIPKEVIESINQQEMKIRFINGSILQLAGTDNVDRLVGTNPSLIVFSEYALQDPRAYMYLRPILAANSGGTAIFLSTPRGRSNHLYDLYQVALKSPSYWYACKLTLDDTKHIPLEEIERERAEGIISEDLIQQEYFCSFSMGAEGAFYTKYIDKMRLEGRITHSLWDGGHKVHTAWDIGWDDATAIIFFQVIGKAIHIIDFYERNKEGLEHYANIIKSKPYTYGAHIFPHDMKVHDLSIGRTRLEKMQSLGIHGQIASHAEIMDGIEMVRSTFPRIWIDESKCAQLIRYLENYRQEYDHKRNVYSSKPLHDINSHAADALRYLCVSLPKTEQGMTAEEHRRIRAEALYSPHNGLPPMFQDHYY